MKFFSLLHIIVYSFAAVSFFIFTFHVSYCSKSLLGKSSQGRSPIIDENKMYQGYTLYSQDRKLSEFENSGMVYMVDLYGKVVHSWKTRYPVISSYLKENGNLVVAITSPEKESFIPAGGETGIIQELDWNGNVIWEYKNEYLHHDFSLLPSGNIAAIVWEKVPKDIAKNIQGGIAGTEYNGDVWADSFIEVNKAGEIVWSWSSYKYLDVKEDVLNPISPRTEWSHGNSIQYTSKNLITNTEAYLVSLREIDTVLMIDKKSKNIIWRSPKELNMSHQHDATFLSNGNILVFDNGFYRNQNPRAPWSRVIEIDPKQNKIVWEFSGKSGLEKAQFFASISSGAQRLKNGNTLISNGPQGHLLEVTPEKQIVWDFVIPYSDYSTGVVPRNFIFKARRYSDEIQWPVQLPDSSPFFSSLCAKM